MSDSSDDRLRSMFEWFAIGPVPDSVGDRARRLFGTGNRARAVATLLHDSQRDAPLTGMRTGRDELDDAITLVYDAQPGHLIVDASAEPDGMMSLDVEYLGDEDPSTIELSARPGAVVLDDSRRATFGGIAPGVYVLTLAFRSFDCHALIDLLGSSEPPQ